MLKGTLMSQNDPSMVVLFPIFVMLADDPHAPGVSAMNERQHRLRLTVVEPEDDLAPIPIARATERTKPSSRPRLQSIQFAEDALAQVERDFARLKLLSAEFDGPDRPRAA